MGEATMAHSGLEFILTETWTAIRRNLLVTLAAIGNMAVSVTILGAFALGAINLDYLASLQAKSAVISVYLEDDADAGAIEAKLYGDLRVKETEFVSKQQALQEWGAMTGVPPEKLQIIGDPLPDLIRVRVVNPDDLAAVAEFAAQLEGVSEAPYNQPVTEKLVTLSHTIKVSGLVLGILLVAGTMLIVSTTIRLTIYARRREVRIMQLVGATDWFIRAPLLCEGAFQGIVGGLLASLFLVVSYVSLHSFLRETLEFIRIIYSGQFLAVFALGLILAGALFGTAGALLSTNRYLAET